MTNLELAKDPKTDPKILEKLSCNNDPNVRIWVAKNPNTPPETLERLYCDIDIDIRMCVPWNSNTSPKIISRWEYNKSGYVFFGVIQNPNTHQYIKDHFRFKNFIGNYT
jgi:hypothetical protein